MIHPPDRDLNPLDRGFNTLCKRRLLQCPSDPIDRRGLRAGGKGKRGGGRGGGGERKEGSKESILTPFAYSFLLFAARTQEDFNRLIMASIAPNRLLLASTPPQRVNTRGEERKI